MNNIIYKYVRDHRGNLNGCLVGFKQSGEETYSIGWSKFNKNDSKFSKDMAFEIAFGRATTGALLYDHGNQKFPASYYDVMNKFMHRCSRYFKQQVLVNK